MGELGELVRDYGPWIYALLFAYTALKSGYLPVVAGYFASLGDLDVALVAMSAFLGAWLGDEARFWIAHRYADGIRAMPRLARSIQVAETAIDRYGAYYIFLYRYAKGLRTLGSIPFGLLGWRWRRFAPLNLSSAAVWVAVTVGLGYLAGGAAVAAIGDQAGSIGVLILVLMLAGSAIVVSLAARNAASAAKQPASPPP